MLLIVIFLTLFKILILSQENNNNHKRETCIILNEKEILRLKILLKLIENELHGKLVSENFDELSSLLFLGVLKATEIKKEELVLLYIFKYLLNAKNYFFIGDDFNFLDGDTEETFSQEYIFENYLKLLSPEISLVSMLREAISKSVFYMNTCTKFSKEAMVGVCYNSLQDYKTYNLNSKQKDQMSHHKLTVITSLIILKLNPKPFISLMKIIENNNYSTTALDDALAYYTRKFVKKRYLKK